MLNNLIGEFIGPFTVQHHDERSKTVSTAQDGVIKRYSTFQIRPFLEKPSMLDDSFTERKIEERQDKTDNYREEAEFDADNEQLNIDQQSYREQ